MSGDENLWYVKTADGEVHRVTLDQLDEAFQAGRIDGNVMVLGPGAAKWQTLTKLAGLDEALPPAAPVAFLPTTLRPVGVDLSPDLDNAFRKKSPKKLLVGGAVAALALCGAIVAVGRGGDSVAPAVAAAAPPPASVAPPPSAANPVAAAAPAPSAASPLTEDQKAKLAAADQALKAKTHKKSRAGGGHHAPQKYKSQGFTTGGNKYDPLNSSL